MYLMHKSNHLTRWLCASRGCLSLHPSIGCRRLLWINFIVQFWVLGPLLHGFQDVHAASPTSESHYMGLIGECFNCHNAPALKTRDGLDSTWVKQPMYKDWAEHDLHAIASRALENEHGLQVLQRLGNTKEMRQRCLACHATPIKGTAFPVADIQEVEFDVQHGVSCEACHGPYEKWETIHRSSLWRKMPLKEKQEYSGFVEMRDPLIRAERCASCHVGSLEEQKFITHAMYVAGHPPLFGYEMQGYLESMPKHWLPIREKPAAIQQEQEDAGLWQKDTLSGGQASFVGQAVSLRVALETLADVAEKSMHDESGFAWPELGLMDCASCHHDLRDKSWRRDPVRVAQVGDRGSNRLPAPGRPGLPTWSRVALIDPGLVDVWNSADKAGDVAALLTNLEPNDVLFIDEIHRLSAVVEEILYPALEDYQLDIMIGEGPSARSIKLDLQPFTLVGATTRAGLLTSPLRDRFGIVQRLEFYNVEDLTGIVIRSGRILGLSLEEEGALEIATRARGTPRIANRLLRRVRDFAEVKADGNITAVVANDALDMLEVDKKGFDSMDRKLLLAIIEKFDGGPVGVDSLSAAIGEERDTIEDVFEPYLIQQGFIMRTPRGRVATRHAYQHFGLKMPGHNENSGGEESST